MPTARRLLTGTLFTLLVAAVPSAALAQCDQLVVRYDGYSNTYRWSVDGDYLTLRWQKTTFPPHIGIPEEVFQRALYMTARFKRVG